MTRRLMVGGAIASTLTLAGLTVSTGQGEGQPGAATAAGDPPSVILLIGDGMGDSEITMARNYEVGADGRLALDSFPASGAWTTHSVDEHHPERPDYVADSAATATAFATGHKTSDKRVSTEPGTNRDLKTILELAQERDMRTGLATTGGLATATTAAFMSHVRVRACQGPTSMSQCPNDRKAAGGPGSIAEQAIDHRVDVLLGGGRAHFEQVIDAGQDRGRSVAEVAARRGYEVLHDAAALQETGPGRRVLGLFSPMGMPPEWRGHRAMPGEGSGPQRCEEGRRPAADPSLATMTRKSLELLENDRGFFLLVEGAAIDTRAHEADPCGQVGETVALDRAVRVVLDYAERHPNTLVVLSADHGHAGQIVPVDAEPDAQPPGRSSTLLTKEGVRMKVSYATVPPDDHQKHTGTQVRVAARGPFAAEVSGVIDQTDAFDTMRKALGGPGA